MRCVFKQGKQRELLIDSINKVGSERKLSKLTGISKGAIYKYKFEKRHISLVRLNKILNTLGKNSGDVKKDIIKYLPDSWGQKKGGLSLIIKKKKEGTFESTIEKLKRSSSRRMRAWHRITKKKNPKKYFEIQYDRFKKIGRYTHICGNLEVRNGLEAKIAKFLIEKKIRFEYESCIIVKGKAYFPDFKIGKLLIEATFWSHPKKEKIKYLNTKIIDYKAAGYDIIFFIPESHRNFYKGIRSTLISNLKDLTRFMPP